MQKYSLIILLLWFCVSGLANSENDTKRCSIISEAEAQFEKYMLLTAKAFCKNQTLDYAIGVDNSLHKVFGSILTFKGKVGLPVKISLAKGEYESVQVMVLAGKKPLSSVCISISDLVGPCGAKLSASDIKIRLVGYVEITNHPGKSELTGEWWPDPLLDNAPFGIEALHVQPIWITVYAPPSIQSGEYHGFLTVSPKDCAEVQIPFTVKIWNFELPQENHFKTSFLLYWNHDSVSHPEFEQWAAFALSYRLGIMTAGWGLCGTQMTSLIQKTDHGYDYTQIDENLEFCFDRHMNSTSMGDSAAGDFGEKYKAEQRQFLRDYANHLENHGWLEKFYYKLQDEPDPQMYKIICEQAEFIKSIDPRIKRLCTVSIVPELIGSVDIWCPLTSRYDKEKAIAAQKRGEEVWAYTCMLPLPPAPNIAYIRQDAIGNRKLPWQCWTLGATGYLYWGIKNWPSVNTRQPSNSVWTWSRGQKCSLVVREQAGKNWPRLLWIAKEGGLPAGDGYLAYPGPNGIPLPSIRLECFRDGIEDLEYLYLLQKRAEKLWQIGEKNEAVQIEQLLTEARKIGNCQEKNCDLNSDTLLRIRSKIADKLSK